jgi:hypothetical protein
MPTSDSSTITADTSLVTADAGSGGGLPYIVQLNVSETLAPTPSRLQQTGAIPSQGATTVTPGGTALITQVADLSSILAAPLALTSLAWSGGTVVATTSAAIPGRTTGDKFSTTIAGATPSGYNGLVTATVTGANTFTYAVANNPGTESVAGTYTPPGQGELVAQITTFFSQGSSQAVYVLELGAGDAIGGPAGLQSWIQSNPGVFYSYLTPKGWDASAGLLALIATLEALTAKTYLFVTTTTATYSTYTTVMKCVLTMIQAPGTPITEFSWAAGFQRSLTYNPSSANMMTQFCFSFLFGVTPWTAAGNSALLATLKAANVNYVGTGAEGGISNLVLFWGRTMDGQDFSWWYAADWYQIQSQQALANTVINGSNNSINPLWYNQPGINRLQDSVVNVAQNGVTYGLLNGSVARAALDGPAFATAIDNGVYDDVNVINAIPFTLYTQENPSAYAQRTYGGLAAQVIPNNGFQAIIFNINVTNLLVN